MSAITMLIKPASGLCNMKCKYCFYADVADHRNVKNYGIMNDETLENMVRKAIHASDEFVSFAFQGGEPTLAGIDYFKKLISLQKSYNTKNIPVYNSIQTNGYNISEEFAKFFKENNFLVGISIDGTKELHDTMRIDKNNKGTYDRILKTTKLFDKYNVDYNILCVVNNLIANNPEKVFNSLKNFKYLQFIPCIDDFEGEKKDFSLNARNYGEFLKRTFDLYYQNFKKDNYISIRNFDNYINMLMGRPPESCAMCGVCSCYYLIEADGSVYPCDFYVLDEWKLGNINNDPMRKMLKTETAKKFIEISKYISPECKQCKWFGLCRGGCRRDREPIVDGKPSLNKYCQSYIAFFEYSYKRMIEIADDIYKSRT